MWTLTTLFKKKEANWADEFSKDALGEILLIICNKIVWVYKVDETIK